MASLNLENCLNIPDDFDGYSKTLFNIPKHYEDCVGNVLIPGSAKRQIQADTSRYKQIQPDTSRYKQIQPDTTRYNQIQTDTNRYNQIQPDTT